jgi:DNA-binding PadR family transcriptional regulator
MKTAQLKSLIFRALKRMGGNPMTREALDNTLALVDRTLLATEIESALRDLEAEGYIAAVRDDLTETVHYTLTIKGQSAAARL